jgi:flagellar basal-body rod modification protein FlgD
VISEIGAVGMAAPAQQPKAGGEMGRDEFLQLLVAQLRHQDPLNPMSGDEMAAQLAHFSSLEQLTNIHEVLKGQSVFHEGIIDRLNDATAMNILGKTVLAVGDQLHVTGEESDHVKFEVEGTGGMATLRIFNEHGTQVGSRELGFVGGGRHTFELGDAAEKLDPGRYTFAVDVVNAAGEAVATQPFISARIDSIRYSAQGSVLTSGPLRIPFGTILQIATD